MEKTLQHEETTQCFGLPPTGSGNHRPDGPGTDHALTFKVDHSTGADHFALPENHASVEKRFTITFATGLIKMKKRRIHIPCPPERQTRYGKVERGDFSQARRMMQTFVQETGCGRLIGNLRIAVWRERA